MAIITATSNLIELFKQYQVSFRYNTSETSWLTEGTSLNIIEGCCIERFASFFRPAPIHSMGAFSYSWSPFGIDARVGRYCSIAGGVKIIPPSHPLDYFTTSSVTYDRSLSSLDALRATSSLATEHPETQWLPHWAQTYPNKSQIIIENDVYIGAEAILRPGVTIGNGSVVAAHSVVTKDVPAYSIVAGNPATVKKWRFPPETAEELLRLKWWNYSIEDILKMGAPSNIDLFIDALKTRIERGDIRRQAIDYISYDQVISSSR